uniref:CARD domain-containing protein n=1 Tax=Neogobius melanostomus TaxID=47308 RepID=A0A8C6U1F1_9GOBI
MYYDDECNLARLRVEFVARISPEGLNQLLDDLLADGILNPGEKDHILQEHRSRVDRARDLFDTVMRKGNTSIEIMMKRLQTRDQALYNHLMPHDLK